MAVDISEDTTERSKLPDAAGGRAARVKVALSAYLGQVTATVEPADAEPDGSGYRPWRRSLVVGGWTWLASHVLMLLVTLVARMPQNFHSYDPDPKVTQPLRGIFLQWAQWDSAHYVTIATQGYIKPQEDTAFFPLYPYLVRLVHFVVPGDVVYSMLLVSNVAAFVALVLVHRLIAHEAGRALAERTTFYLIAFPFAYFLNAAYTESVFIALAAGSLYCMRRGHWWLAGGLAGLASATRAPGIILLAALGFEYLRQRGFRPTRIRPNVLALLLAPSGLVAYAVYCWYSFGNPTQFSAAQKTWSRVHAMPWTTLWHGLKSLNDRPLLNPWHIYNSVDVLFTLAGLVLLVLATVGPWRLRPDQLYLLIFGWLSLAIPLTNPVNGYLPMNSLPRYLLAVLPIFLVLARMGANRHFERVYLMFGIGMQAIWSIMFINNIWAG